MRKRNIIACFVFLLSNIGVWAQTTTSNPTTIRDNWYIQLGMDMSLQNPYGHDFSTVFPNGKTFGLDVALGRWFTPEFGLRAKFNWENGLSLLENGHVTWLAPFDEPGVNLDKGGYLVVAGDIQFNLSNLFVGYNPDRKWEFMLYPRAGMAYNFGVDKGSPLLGIGLGTSYKWNDNLSFYVDGAYNGVSSGFTGCNLDTGIGSNSNGFMDLNVGVQWNLGRPNYKYGLHKKTLENKKEEEWKNGLWDNWFVQFGLDMTLQNPYGHNFSETFPKGKSFGVDLALGKWFSPEVGLRGCLNWENGLPLFKNDHLEWIAVGEGSKSNMDDGGYVLAHIDVLLNLNNLFVGFDPERRGSVLFYPRAGLVSNLSTGSGSPVVGFGCGYNYRLTECLSLYANLAYQMTTSEFFGNQSLTGASGSLRSNGFMDLELGVQWNLGK